MPAKHGKPYRPTLTLPADTEKVADDLVGVLGTTKADVLKNILLSAMLEKGWLKKK